MKLSMKARAATAFLLVCVAIVPVIAQQQGGPGRQGGGPGRSLGLLVHMTSVQKELQLTSDQIQKINEMHPPQGGPGGERGPGGPPEGRGNGGPGGPPEGQAGPPQGGPGGPPEGPGGDQNGRGEPKDNPLAKILNQNQLERLKQLGLQFEAPRSLVQPDVAKALNLSDDQRQSIDEIARSMMPRPEQGQRPDWNTMQAKKQEATNKAFGMLSNDQKQAWSKLTGKVFTNWEEPRRQGN